MNKHVKIHPHINNTFIILTNVYYISRSHVYNYLTVNLMNY